MPDNCIVLDGAVTIAKAEALHQDIEHKLHEEPKLTIDATAVERADTSIIQLLSVLVEGEESSTVDVSIKGSEGLLECTNLLGFSSLAERYII